MNLLFVCTGNICRSPLAEAIARDALARAGAQADVASAGTHAQAGRAASDYAQTVAERQGLDLSRHRSRQLTAQLAEWADLIIAMAPEHAAAARSLATTEIIEIGPVPDPIFGSLDDYQRTFDLLIDAMPHILARIPADHRLPPAS